MKIVERHRADPLDIEVQAWAEREGLERKRPPIVMEPTFDQIINESQ